jgi:hypothetical protein
MKAYIKVVYSSEGVSPVTVEGIFSDHGFHKVSGHQAFEAEVSNAEEYRVKVEAIHPALKGTGIRYMLTSGKPFEGNGSVPTYRERMEKWRETGIDVDELSDLLENNIGNFRRRASEMAAIQFERIAAEREKEIQENEDKEKAEAVRKHAVDLLTSKDGHTFMELVKESGMEEDDLQQMLLDLVEKGRIKAEQRGRHVVYVAL